MSDWRPYPGAQTAFLACGAFEACTGGIVGGGKTSSLLVGPLRYVHRPGFSALILRRHYTELTKSDGLIQRAWNLYPRVGGRAHDGGLSWTWESGARIDLAGMDQEVDRFKYDGSAYQFMGFDELQTFAEVQYVYMVSRMRQNDRILASGPPIPLRLRSTATPGGVGHDWVVARFSPWVRIDDDDYDGRRADDGEWLFFRHDEELDREVMCEPGEAGAQSRAFFRTEQLPYVGEEYRHALDRLDPVTRRQRKFGDWLVRPGAGSFFQREWWAKAKGTLLERRPRDADVIFRVRGWDLAATEKHETTTPAATASARLAVLRDGRRVVEDVTETWGRPAAVEQLIVSLAESDDALDTLGRKTLVSLPQDPGQAGKSQRARFAELLADHWWRCTPEVGDKAERAKPTSSAAEQGEILLVQDEWTENFIRRAVDFPKGKLKDVIDALSRADQEARARRRRGKGSSASGREEKGASMHDEGGY